MAKINSSDISQELAEQMGISKSMAKVYVDFIFDKIKEHAEAGDIVNIKMFGKFKMDITAPRKGYNINAKEKTDIAPKHKLKFEMSRTLNEQYNTDE